MQALAGARQVHEFDRTADETSAWIAEKESALLGAAPAPPRSQHALHSQQRALHALRADLDAIAKQHEKLKAEAER